MGGDIVQSDYRAPRSVEEAVAILAGDSAARVLAGGTDLLVQLRGGASAPSVFVDVKRIPALGALVVDANGLRIGASVPCAEIFENDDVRRVWPGLAEAVDLIGSTQIQGRATVGGNLCNASPAADTVPALIALEARCVVAGPQGERIVEVEDFHTGPGEALLEPGELVVALEVPRPPPRSADAYQRLIPRTEMDIAVAGAAVALTLDEAGVCTRARVAIGAVAPTARLVAAAADALIGTPLDDESLARAAAAASEAAEPISDKRGTADYRRKVVGVLVRRTASRAAERVRA